MSLGTQTAPAQNEAPTESTEKPKKQVRKQIKYPGLQDADGNPVKLKEFPADFNLTDHKPFIRKDFEDETLWLDWRADFYEAKAKGYRDEAAMIRQYGSPEDQKAAKKLLAMQKKFAALQAQLTGDGIDVAGILSSIGVDTDEE